MVARPRMAQMFAGAPSEPAPDLPGFTAKAVRRGGDSVEHLELSCLAHRDGMTVVGLCTAREGLGTAYAAMTKYVHTDWKDGGEDIDWHYCEPAEMVDVLDLEPDEVVFIERLIAHGCPEAGMIVVADWLQEHKLSKVRCVGVARRYKEAQRACGHAIGHAGDMLVENVMRMASTCYVTPGAEGDQLLSAATPAQQPRVATPGSSSTAPLAITGNDPDTTMPAPEPQQPRDLAPRRADSAPQGAAGRTTSGVGQERAPPPADAPTRAPRRDRQPPDAPPRAVALVKTPPQPCTLVAPHTVLATQGDGVSAPVAQSGDGVSAPVAHSSVDMPSGRPGSRKPPQLLSAAAVAKRSAALRTPPLRAPAPCTPPALLAPMRHPSPFDLYPPGLRASAPTVPSLQARVQLLSATAVAKRLAALLPPLPPPPPVPPWSLWRLRGDGAAFLESGRQRPALPPAPPPPGPDLGVCSRCGKANIRLSDRNLDGSCPDPECRASKRRRV